MVRWTCISQRPGRTLIPSVEMTSAPRGTSSSPNPPDGGDALALDEDDGVVERRTAVAVDEPSSDQGLGSLGVKRRGEEQEKARDQ